MNQQDILCMIKDMGREIEEIKEELKQQKEYLDNTHAKAHEAWLMVGN